MTDYKLLSASGRYKTFTRGQILYTDGDSVQRIIMLTAGLVKLTKIGHSGSEVILRLGVPGDVLGAVGLFSAGRHFVTAQAFRTCHALIWDTPSFRGLVERFPVLQQNMVRTLDEYSRELENRLHEVATEKVSPRVARQLVRLLSRIGRRVDRGIEIGLSREELALMTGTTLFTVSRLLSEWEALGLVQRRREAVIILDPSSLQSLSEQG